MKVGIAAATYLEIQPTINFLSQQSSVFNLHEFHIVITGIGSMLTSYQLHKFIQKHHPDYMIQAGVGGTFTEKFERGDVVAIREEMLGDLGVFESETFHDVFDLGLMEPSSNGFTDKRLVNPHVTDWQDFDLTYARGLTVNQISSNPKLIEKLLVKYGCEVESLEGAAFHYMCLQEQIPFLQLRSISNTVGERNKINWRLKEAIRNLNDQLLTIIKLLP